MKAFKLTLIALGASVSLAIAHADESDKMEIVVVTAERPDLLEPREPMAIEQSAPEIELPTLAIEAPSLESTGNRLRTERIEVALNENTD